MKLLGRWFGGEVPRQPFDEAAYMREQREESERVWDFLYANYPPPPGTETKQVKHRQLSRIENPSEEQEQESTALFLELFPFARPPEERG